MTPGGNGVARRLVESPLFEIARMLVRLDHVAGPHRKRESQRHVSGRRIWRDRL